MPQNGHDKNSLITKAAKAAKTVHLQKMSNEFYCFWNEHQALTFKFKT